MLFKTRSVTEGFTEYSESSQNLAVMSTIEKLRTPSFRLFPYSFARRARPASASPAQIGRFHRIQRKFTKPCSDEYYREIAHPEFQIVSIFFRAARPPGVGVTGPGTRGLPSRAFACTRETPEPRRGQNQRSGHAADCHDGRRRIRDRACTVN